LRPVHRAEGRTWKMGTEVVMMAVVGMMPVEGMTLVEGTTEG
jgi:hypothetical protein